MKQTARCLPFACALVWAGALVVSSAAAQGRKADYERAARLRELARGKVFRTSVQPHWFANGDRFWYRLDLADGKREFVLVDAAAGVRRLAFDHARAARALATAIGKPVDPEKLPIDSLEYGADGASVVLMGPAGSWDCSLSTYALQRREGAAPAGDSLPALEAPRPSRSTGAETSITFVNNTQGEVRVFWLDTDGGRSPYGTVPAGGTREQHTFAGHVWLLQDAGGRDIAAFEATEAPARAVVGPGGAAGRPGGRRPGGRRTGPAPSRPEAVSPDGKLTAVVRDHNVWLRDQASGQETALTTDGSAEDQYGLPVYWSPDSTRLVAVRTVPAEDHKVTVVQSSPPGRVQPKTVTFDYLKPGDRLARPRPHLFDVAARREVPIDPALFDNPWDIYDYRWAPDSSRFTFIFNQRGHQVLRLLAVDARSGAVRAVVDEQSKTFVDYAGKFFLEYLDATGEVLWMSERDGWCHLYLVDAATGAVKSQVTRGPWVVRGVERVDAAARQVWFRAGGAFPDQDPYHVHFGRVGFDGSGLTWLTRGDGTHALTYSPDRRYYLDVYSRVDLPAVTELRRTADGTLVREVERGDARALSTAGIRPPERFVAKGRDGVTDIYGIIVRPTNFRPGRRYPVLENIYAGPHGAHVPKGWSNLAGSQEMADLGFVVVHIDGMGTSWRSKAFHDVAWRNIADAGFPDRIRWMKAAAATRPWMDLTRVGIYGGSAGGQNALGALLFHPEFYKVGVADCGCHDNRMDKVWWNELWMGWPVGPHYAEQSNVTNAHRLQGKLLLMVGEMDNNVDPASTMQVVNALVKADKDFDLLVAPNVGHGVAGTPHGRRRQQDFFVRHLLGVEPRRP